MIQLFNMVIRPLEKKDIPEVENIFDLYWKDDFRENLSKKLVGYTENASEIVEQGFKYFVADDNAEVIGVLGFRNVPSRMREFVTTNNSVELYILAVKNKKGGIGKKLVEKCINEAKEMGRTEVVLYSGETHSESWGFYDHLDFKRVGPATAPNGEQGQIWRMQLI